MFLDDKQATILLIVAVAVILLAVTFRKIVLPRLPRNVVIRLEIFAVVIMVLVLIVSLFVVFF